MKKVLSSSITREAIVLYCTFNWWCKKAFGQFLWLELTKGCFNTFKLSCQTPPAFCWWLVLILAYTSPTSENKRFFFKTQSMHSGAACTFSQLNKSGKLYFFCASAAACWDQGTWGFLPIPFLYLHVWAHRHPCKCVHFACDRENVMSVGSKEICV